MGTCEQSGLWERQTKQNKTANKQVKQIKQAKLKPYQVSKLNIRNSTKRRRKASFGWVSSVQPRELRKSTKQSKLKHVSKANQKKQTSQQVSVRASKRSKPSKQPTNQPINK